MPVYSQSALEAYGIYARYYQLLKNPFKREEDYMYKLSKIREEEENILLNSKTTFIDKEK